MLQHKQLDFALETKSVAETGVFEGHASTFGNIDLGGDAVQPGAFGASLVKSQKEGRIIPLLWDHDPGQPIGVWHDIVEDKKGLYVKGELLIESDPQARKIHALMLRKGVGGLSIGYRVTKDGIERDEKRGVNLLKVVDLREVSIVTMPMNLKAKISDVKSIIEAGGMPTERELEKHFRDEMGLSDKLAKTFVSALKPHLRRDAEPAEDQRAAFLNRILERL